MMSHEFRCGSIQFKNQFIFYIVCVSSATNNDGKSYSLILPPDFEIADELSQIIELKASSMKLMY